MADEIKVIRQPTGIGYQVLLPPEGESYLLMDHFGRLYFDRCATAEEHMVAEVLPGDDRRKCRQYLDDLLPFYELLGKKGRWAIVVEFEGEL